MIFLQENAIMFSLTLWTVVLVDVLFLMEMDNATIAPTDLEELMDNVNLELNIVKSISKMVLAKNAILNILWYSANANITLYLDAKLSSQTILAQSATNLLV